MQLSHSSRQYEKEIDNSMLMYREKLLIVGEVDPIVFLLLIKISSIRSEKVINSLYDYFVAGEPRNIACDRHGVSQGFLSLKIKALHDLSHQIKKYQNTFNKNIIRIKNSF